MTGLTCIKRDQARGLAMAIGLAVASWSHIAAARTVKVEIPPNGADTFVPYVAEANPGDTVEWTNKETLAGRDHTVTPDSSVNLPWFAGKDPFPRGQTYTINIPPDASPQIIGYHCDNHGGDNVGDPANPEPNGMSGIIKVVKP